MPRQRAFPRKPARIERFQRLAHDFTTRTPTKHTRCPAHAGGVCAEETFPLLFASPFERPASDLHEMWVRVRALACADPNRPGRPRIRCTARAPDISGFHSARGSPGFANSSAITLGDYPTPEPFRGGKGYRRGRAPTTRPVRKGGDANGKASDGPRSLTSSRAVATAPPAGALGESGRTCRSPSGDESRSNPRQDLSSESATPGVDLPRQSAQNTWLGTEWPVTNKVANVLGRWPADGGNRCGTARKFRSEGSVRDNQ